MEIAEHEWAPLIGHSSTPSRATMSIDAHARIGESGSGVFRYVLRGEISRLSVPAAPSAERRAEDLWKHTCFEAFIKAAGTAGYYEFNFAPSGQWAMYRFAAYREGMSSPDLCAPPKISARRFADRLEIDAAVPLGALIGLQGATNFNVGLSAVVEEDNGTLSYWALKHPRGRPDFHSPDGFVLELKM